MPRAFRATFGETPQRYLQLRRVERADRVLHRLLFRYDETQRVDMLANVRVEYPRFVAGSYPVRRAETAPVLRLQER